MEQRLWVMYDPTATVEKLVEGLQARAQELGIAIQEDPKYRIRAVHACVISYEGPLKPELEAELAKLPYVSQIAPVSEVRASNSDPRKGL